MAIFSLFTIDKKKLEILLGDFAEKKETYVYYKKQNFSKSKKSHFFPNGLIQALDKKMPNSSLFTFGHNIIRLDIMLSDFAERKETFFDYKKKNFFKSKRSPFPKGLTHAFGQKLTFFFSS